MFSHHVSICLYVNCTSLLIKEDNFACLENMKPPTVVVSDKSNGCVLKTQQKISSLYEALRRLNERNEQKFVSVI